MKKETIKKYNIKQSMQFGVDGQRFESDLGTFRVEYTSKDMYGNPRIVIQPLGFIRSKEMPSIPGTRVNRFHATYTVQCIDFDETMDFFFNSLGETGFKF